MAVQESIALIWNAFVELFSGVLSNFILAIIILLIGFIIGRIVSKILKRGLHEIELDRLFKRAIKLKFSIEELFSNITAFLIYFVTIIMALNQLGLTTTILYIISIGIIVIIILSVFLSIKDFIPNLIAGIFIHEKRDIKEGDMIRFKDIEGKIVGINLVETKIQTKKGDLLFIPNANLTKTEFIKKRR